MAPFLFGNISMPKRCPGGELIVSVRFTVRIFCRTGGLGGTLGGTLGASFGLKIDDFVLGTECVAVADVKNTS